MSAKKFFALLDRDGTIIVDKPYQQDPSITELLPNAKEGLEVLRRAGFDLVLVSNQSGVGRGLLTRDAVDAVNQSMLDKLGGLDGCFAGLYYCVHTPDDGCDCRKPGPGLAMRAAGELGFDLAGAFVVVVGDRESDIGLAAAIGAKSVLVRTGHGAEVEQAKLCRPDYVADDLLDAAKWIVAAADSL